MHPKKYELIGKIEGRDPEKVAMKAGKVGIMASDHYATHFGEERILLESIEVLPSHEVKLTPFHGQLGWNHEIPGSATELAVLAHDYGVRTNPEQAFEYGISVTIDGAHFGRMLAVLTKHGLDPKIAEKIAHEQEVRIPKQTSLRGTQVYDEETRTGDFPFRQKVRKRKQDAENRDASKAR